MGTIAQALFRRSMDYQSSRLGVALEDFAAIPATPDLGDEIMQGLQSGDPVDRRVSLFFCEGFLKYDRALQLGGNLVESLPSEAVRLAADPDDLTRSAAHLLLIAVRGSVAGYRDLMLKALTDQSSSVRTGALNATETFLKPSEIEPLLSFEHDAYLSEVGGMGGPVHYVLRNQALATVERLTGRQFAKHELTEMVQGEVVFWWDWRPMLEWYRASKNRFWAKLRDKLND
jgi:hypothetical protein